jgi:hypothetical protein
MGLGTPELWSLLRDEDRVAFAQWLGSTDIWTAKGRAETVIAEGLAQCVKEDLEGRPTGIIDPRAAPKEPSPNSGGMSRRRGADSAARNYATSKVRCGNKTIPEAAARRMSACGVCPVSQ